MRKQEGLMYLVFDVGATFIKYALMDDEGNAGDEGAKRDSIYEYLKDVLPQNKTEEQRLRMLGDLLKAMKMEKLIKTDGQNWFLL